MGPCITDTLVRIAMDLEARSCDVMYIAYVTSLNAGVAATIGTCASGTMSIELCIAVNSVARQPSEAHSRYAHCTLCLQGMRS